jgi:ABC-type transport system substrate-binding protein
VHINPTDGEGLLVLDTRVVPFNDIRVRKALKYAVDRAKIAALVGSAATPTCQLLPPYIPGYARCCPYTLHPNRACAWTAPDIATAERLIADSHTRGTAITLWNFGIVGSDDVAIASYIVSLLDRLGYRAQQRNLTSASAAAYGRFADSRTKAQVALVGWGVGFPAASESIQALLSCETSAPTPPTTPTELRPAARGRDPPRASSRGSEVPRRPHLGAGRQEGQRQRAARATRRTRPH